MVQLKAIKSIQALERLYAPGEVFQAEDSDAADLIAVGAAVAVDEGAEKPKRAGKDKQTQSPA